MRVLVVEDDSDNAKLAQALIGHCGHEAKVANNGFEALEIGQQWRPELVLLDLGLPGMDGYLLASKLRDEAGLHEARIIAVSGYQENPALNEASGINGHLLKPVGLEDLRKLLGE